MKNKSFIVFILLLVLYFNEKSLAQEFKFETSEINISEKGNIILANEGYVFFPKKKLRINAQNFKYDKKKLTLSIKKGVAEFTENKIKIYADELYYDENKSILKATGDVQINDVINDINIKTDEVYYNIPKEIIQSELTTVIKSYPNNQIKVEGFIYTLKDKLIKMKNIEMIDGDNNLFKLEKSFLNINTNKLIGKDVSINLNNKSFNKENEPRFKGNSITVSEDETIIKKSIFTTCKKSDKCPPWQMSAEEIRHDKKSKTINYKNAFLKIYDVPVFYFPKFFHPDPSVTRQSGFLIPKIQDSSSLGAALNLPYFLVLSNNKDLTFSPRLYTKNKYLVQSEFRHVDKNSKNIIDFSVLKNKKNSKNHFFLESENKLNFEKFDESSLSIKLENTSNETYLKTYKLESPLIKNENLLNSYINIDLSRDDLVFSANAQVYEDLTKNKSDRFEFILPNFNLEKQLDNNTNFDGEFKLISDGYMKNYNTNIDEKVFINDLIFNSDDIVNNTGILSEYNFIIKNVTTDSKNSDTYKNKLDSSISSMLEYKSSYPMKKETNNYKNILRPQASVRAGTNQIFNYKNNNQRSSIEDIYGVYRSGSNKSLEGGVSLTYGANFEKYKKSDLDKKILGVEIANVLRLEENQKIARNSALDEKISDFLGRLEYDPIDAINIEYDFSIKNNFKEQNYELLSTTFKVNNFLTTFEYLNEENTFDKESYLANTTTYSFDNSNDISFKTRKNKKTKLTEFYNLIYQYTNDCLTAAIEYRKDYYSDRDLTPEESIFLKLTIIPIGGANSPNFKP
jgi:LPS-assembly protein